MLCFGKSFQQNGNEKLENDIQKYNGKALVLRGCENETFFCSYLFMSNASNW